MILADLRQPSRALARIADLCLRELQAFGRLTSPVQKLPMETYTKYARQRAMVILLLYKELESAGGLRFSAEDRFPFTYHLNRRPDRWPEDLPPTGYVADAPSVRPSDLATSLIVGFEARVTGTSFPRTFKSALWQTKVSGLHDGIALAFDLHRTGLASTDDLHETIRLLLHGRARVSSDAEMVEAFLGGAKADAVSWLSLKPKDDWAELGDARPDADLIDVLLSQITQEIDRVRDSSDYDAWHIGQVQLCKLLLVNRMLINEFWGADNLPLTWRAKLDHWEEIQADATGVAGLAMLPMASLPAWRLDAPRVKEFAAEYRARGGGNWRRRFYRERLLVPGKLHEQVLDDPTEVEVSEEWRGLSRHVIRPWMAALRSFASPDQYRAVSYPPEGLVNHPEVQAAFRTLGVEDRTEQLRMIRAYEKQELKRSSARPTSRSLGTDDRGVPVFYVNMGLDKPSPDEERVLTTLNEVIPRAQTEYKKNEQGLEAESRLRIYPYDVKALYETARNRALHGEPDQAIEGFIDFILLEPTAGFAWQALAAVLSHTGYEREASLAIKLAKGFRG